MEDVGSVLINNQGSPYFKKLRSINKHTYTMGMDRVNTTHLKSYTASSIA